MSGPIPKSESLPTKTNPQSLPSDYEQFDVIVCGLGINGAAALYQLSQVSDLKVLGLEAKVPGHSDCGSAGETRLLRHFHFEEPRFIPAIERSLELWKRLESESDEKLLSQTGLFYLSEENDPLMTGLRQCSQIHRLPLERQDPSPNLFRVPTGFECLLENGAQVIFSERSIDALMKQAVKNGARFCSNTPVEEITRKPDWIQIKTATRVFRTKKVLSTLGGWGRRFFKDWTQPVEIQEGPVFWFGERSENAKLNRPFMIKAGSLFVYGFPDFGAGVKIGSHHAGASILSPDARDPLSQFGLADILQVIERFLPSVEPQVLKSHTCFFDLTPDEKILLDFHPADSRIVAIGGGSGIGFKMAPWLAQMAVQMLLVGTRPAESRFLAREY